MSFCVCVHVSRNKLEGSNLIYCPYTKFADIYWIWDQIRQPEVFQTLLCICLHVCFWPHEELVITAERNKLEIRNFAYVSFTKIAVLHQIQRLYVCLCVRYDHDNSKKRRTRGIKLYIWPLYQNCKSIKFGTKSVNIKSVSVRFCEHSLEGLSLVLYKAPKNIRSAKQILDLHAKIEGALPDSVLDIFV